ncbi:MAG: hypothetical protein IT473_14715 [Lysobacter sp.]|nr:hypothetical protein [Lysobacter sp.]
MSRKLIHSIRAIVVSFGVLAAVAAVGLPSTVGTPSPIATVAPTQSDPAVAPSVDAQPTPTAPKKHGQRRRLPREEMSLPFFSFAHGLRRGNGS